MSKAVLIVLKDENYQLQWVDVGNNMPDEMVLTVIGGAIMRDLEKPGPIFVMLTNNWEIQANANELMSIKTRCSKGVTHQDALYIPRSDGICYEKTSGLKAFFNFKDAAKADKTLTITQFGFKWNYEFITTGC